MFGAALYLKDLWQFLLPFLPLTDTDRAFLKMGGLPIFFSGSLKIPV